MAKVIRQFSFARSEINTLGKYVSRAAILLRPFVVPPDRPLPRRSNAFDGLTFPFVTAFGPNLSNYGQISGDRFV
jgi:hypothetical protein